MMPLMQSILPSDGSLLGLYKRHWSSILALSLIYSLVFCEIIINVAPFYYNQIWSDSSSISIGILVGVVVLLIQLSLMAILQISITDLIGNTSPLPWLSDRLSLALRRYLGPVLIALLLNLICLVVSMLLAPFLFIILFPVVLVFASAFLTIGFIVILGGLSPTAAIKKVISIGRKYTGKIFLFSLTLDVALFFLALVSLGSRYDELLLATAVQWAWLASFAYGLIAPALAWLVAIELNSERQIKSELKPAVNPVG